MDVRLDISKVEFSRNDLRSGIQVPEKLTKELAYFLGFHVGDGYLKIQRRDKTVDYRMQYDGHHINEHLWYIDYIKPIIKKLFNKEVNVVRGTTGSLYIAFRSKAILTLLHNCCDIPFSPKKKITVPNIVQN